MQKEMPIREVNQRFTECVRDVEESGDAIIITRHGVPVARLMPVASGQRVLTPKQQAARARIRAWLDEPLSLGIADKFDRDSIYDERLDELSGRRAGKKHDR